LKKRLLIVDEAWWMMKSEDTASFLYSIAKRGRKYYLGLSTITQDVNDFIDSQYGMAIVTNSSMQLLLKQSTSSANALQKVFNLTDEEKYLLLESEVGEGIFFAGLKHVAIKVIASYTEDQIITSDPSQVLAIKKAKEEYKQEETKFSEAESSRIAEAISSRPVEPEPETVSLPQKEEPKESLPKSESDDLKEESEDLDKEIDKLEKMFKDY
jgi:type IV secretory pathway VirB4 component